MVAAVLPVDMGVVGSLESRGVVRAHVLPSIFHEVKGLDQGYGQGALICDWAMDEDAIWAEAVLGISRVTSGRGVRVDQVYPEG